VSAAAQQIPLSRVIAALSFALDLTEGEPPGHAVRTAKIGMRLADAIGLDAGARSDIFYALLLKERSPTSTRRSRRIARTGVRSRSTRRSR
jgi:hypothetical protein